MKKITLLALFITQFCFSQTPQLAFDIYPGQNSSSPSSAVVAGGKMYFSAYFSGFGSELTRFDGFNMPSRVSDIYTGFNSSMGFSDPIIFNGQIHFSATNGTSGQELWTYDGVNAPTMILDINTGSGSSYPEMFIGYNNKLYFYADNSVNGGEIWQYDGINPPTMLLDMFVGASSSLVRHFTVFNGKLYFSAKDSSAPAKIWQYDGTGLPTQVFPNHIAPSYITVFNGKMYMSSYNTTTSAVEFLNFDGTNLSIESNITGPIQADLNGTVYFLNNLAIATNGYELWKYDGISSPTITADLNPGSASSNPQYVTVYNNKIYFVADDGTHGYEVWSYDGNTATLTGQITPNTIDPNISFMKVFNNKLYFNANNGAAAGQNGAELWVIDAPLSTDNFTDVKAKIYPNPVANELNITSNFEFDSVIVYDIHGRVMASKNLEPITSTQIFLDLPHGFYLIQLKSKGETIFSDKLLVR